MKRYTLEELKQLKELPSTVPCNGCTACCKHDRVILDPKRGDKLEQFEWHLDQGIPVLNRRENGECIYLSKKGCSIHNRMPDICKRFDCRILFLTTPKERRRQRVEENPVMKDVYSAGRKRLDTLE